MQLDAATHGLRHQATSHIPKITPIGLEKHLQGVIEYGLIAVCGAALLLVIAAAILHRGQTKSDLSKYGLFGVTGRFGAGKTYFMVYNAAQAMKQARPVYSNFPVRGMNGDVLTSWWEVLDVPVGSMVLIDEAHLWWPSDKWKCPPEVLEWITQVRKKKVTLLYASQDMQFVAKKLRLLSYGIWEGVHLRKGHRFTLYSPKTHHKTGKDRGKLAAMLLVRSAEVEQLYDTNLIVAPCVDEWVSGGPGRERKAVRTERPVRPLALVREERTPSAPDEGAAV